MEGTFGMIRNFFADRILGNIIRFLFDRFFGSIFTTNINLSNIVDLKNCHLKDLTIDVEKINKKAFKNSPVKLFSGKVGSISIKFPPSINALLTESVEVRLDRLDILCVMNDVDFTKAKQEVEAQLNKIFNPDNLQNIFEEKSSGGKPPEDLDIYKKIINRILLNIKLKVENICLRVVSEKPYKEVRLPIAPCFMLKVAKIEIRKNLEQQDNLDRKDSSPNMNFVKNQNYVINIYGITMHVMSNYELKPDEYVGKVVDPKAEFPFTYPNESHPSTIFVCACRKLGKNKILEGNPDAMTDDMEPITININFSNDKSKTAEINIPNIEVMLDFLKIKFLSKYIDKFMEWKKYLDYKKALLEQLGSQKKSPKATTSEVPFHLRKGSFGLEFEPQALQKNRQPDSQNLANFGNPDNPNQNPQSSESHKGSKIRIAGYDIDVNYFQKNEGEETSNEDNQASYKKDVNVDIQGINEIISEPFELTAENILDTSNVHINLNLKSIYIYFLKQCTAFLETEFRRLWLFGNDPHTDLQKSFNKKIPINYFQLKLTKLNLSLHTKESQAALTFSSFQILDVNRVDTPLNIRTSGSNSAQINNISGINKSQAPWTKSELFYSFKFDKSMMSSAIKHPELKRNPTNDLNETSMLFQSAISDITKDFLTMREVRKQIIDWEIDPKREHFCVNIVFKFNKTGQYSFKDKKASDKYKTVKYLEDSVIHSPLNTESLTEELSGVQLKPTLRLSTKGGKIVASLDLPSIYINFYMSLVHDINFLLHNASDSYKIGENWYFEQNQNLLRKWEQELREASEESHPKEDPFKKRDKEKQLKEEVDAVVDAYFKKQNLQLNLEIVLGVPLIKVVFNLESPKKDPTQCFCGFSSHYFGEGLTHNTIFKKEFIVLELCQLAIKILKIPPTDYSYPQDISPKKILGFNIHTLFQSLDVYIPSKMTDENKVLMIKLLSLSAVQDEGKMIIPSIQLTLFEDHVNPFTRQSSEAYSKNMLSPFLENKNEEVKKQNEMPQPDGQIPLEFTTTKPYYTLFQRHMNKNIASDLNYLKMLEEDSSMSLNVTFPKFEVYVSKESLEFLQSFSSDWITLIEDVNEKLRYLLDQEKRIFSSILEINSQPSKAPQITNFSFYIEEISIQIFQDEKISQNFQQVIDAKKNKVKISTVGSSIRLDDSFSGPIFEKATSYTNHISEIRCCFLRREFERALASSFKFIIRHNELAIYKNPKEIVDIIHLEIQDLLIVDRMQESVNFGSFLDVYQGDKGKEYYDEALEYEAKDCIVYKQTVANAWSRSLSTHRVTKEPEAFKEWKNKGILILENTHQSFLNKNKNVLCIGMLKSLREGRLTTDIDAHLGYLVLRSDFKFAFIDMFDDLLKGLKKNKETKEENPTDPVYELEKKESHEDTRIIIQLSLEHILVDLNPYLYYDYCKTFGKVNCNIDPERLNHEHKNNLFYSDTRSVVAVESLGIRLRKRGNKVHFDEFSLFSLDFFMRFQKGDSAFKENRIILQSKENSFFEREFEELKNYHAFKSHPFYLSGLSINSVGNDFQFVDIKLEKIELKLYADTIPVLEKHGHLILCLIEKRKHKNDDQLNNTLEEEKLESENNSMPSRTEIQVNKPKDQVVIEDEIEIDKDYFVPVEINHVSSRALDIGEEHENGFDVIEEINEEDPSNLKEMDAHSQSYESVGSMPSVSTSFISSSTVFYFDEENLHDFTLDHQEISNKISFKLGEISLRVFDSYELDTNPQILEVNFDQFSKEASGPQNVIINKENNKIERLPKCVNETEKAECIMVVVENLKVGLLLFKKNENQRTNMSWRTSVSLQNFEVLDCFKNSKKNEANMKLVSKYNQMSPEALKYNLLQSIRKGNEFIMQNTFDAIFECFENNNCKQKDIRAFVAIHPLEIHIGVPHYNFGKLFAAKMKLKNPTNQLKPENLGEDFIQNESEISKHNDVQIQKKTSEIFFSFFHVAPFELKMNINLDISVINLDLFKNLKLSFPTSTVRGAENVDELKKEIINFYVSKVKTQIGSFVKDLPLLRNIKNLTNATLNLFYSPYMNYREGGNLLTGLKDGVVGFAGSVSNESVNLFTFVTTMLDNVTNLTGVKEKLNKSQDSN